METTVIVSNLHKDDFVANGAPLSLAGQLKLAVLNLAPIDGSDFIDSILHWSELPFLHRIIVIFKTPAAAAKAYEFLQSSYKSNEENGGSAAGFVLQPSVKLSLQENLLQRSRSHEALADASELKVTESLTKFRSKHNGGADYEEPEPQPFDTYNDLKKLGIDVSALNTPEPEKEKSEKSEKLGRSRSVTKTLFKPPPLSLDTKGSTPESGSPGSPSITLEFDY